MSVLQNPAAAPAANPSRPPPLEAGDHLTRVEFERRYAGMPITKKAELVEGVVHLKHRVTASHGQAHAAIAGCMGLYAAGTLGVRSCIYTTVRLDADNEPQPDVLLRLAEDRGGRCRVDEDGYLAGTPELVAEVAVSTASIDLHEKLRAYRRAGVAEYIVWRVDDHAIDWFFLVEGRYDPAPPGAGVVASRVFPGLRLDLAALVAMDLARALESVRLGLAYAGHAAFLHEPRP